jgi:hypothetical protein
MYKKQTAVDFLMDKLFDPSMMVDDQLKWFEQAKEIEKVRMESTWIAALDYAIELLKGLNNLESKDAFDQFYNETFGGGNK